ncbi:MAG: asparagine synthase C-terminal domain-containing protein [Halobacteriaceae archaeon]
MTGRCRGASPSSVAEVISRAAALSGLDGFGGAMPDGRLVRDVLGREPVFYDRETGDWGFEPAAVTDPVSVPAGSVVDPVEDTQHHVLVLPSSTPRSPDAALDALETAITDALAGVRDVPVAFSGGVDSGVVASGVDGPLYVVGFPEGTDIETARSAAMAMDRDLRVVEVDVATLERVVPAVAEAIGRTDVMSVAIATPLYVLAEAVADDGYDRLALGQGADELFAGYEKLAAPAGDDRVSAESTLAARDEALATIGDQIERDVLAVRAAGVEPVVPLLADGVVDAALGLPESLLVRGEARKVGLRRVARDRLPSAVASRDKRAIQYGTLVARELDRLAREAGFKRRMGDHVSTYIRARVGDSGTTVERR